MNVIDIPFMFRSLTELLINSTSTSYVGAYFRRFSTHQALNAVKVWYDLVLRVWWSISDVKLNDLYGGTHQQHHHWTEWYREKITWGVKLRFRWLTASSASWEDIYTVNWAYVMKQEDDHSGSEHHHVSWRLCHIIANCASSDVQHRADYPQQGDHRVQMAMVPENMIRNIKMSL